MENKFKGINNESILPMIAIFIVILIAVVGLYAMLYGSKYEDDFGVGNSHYDYYICSDCNTKVPCSRNYKGRMCCPSCGGIMNQIAGGAGGLFSNTGIGGTGLSVAGGIGLGLGPVGNLVCPDCGMVIQHQRGVPCYTVNCPQCGAAMMRQFPANTQTAFTTMNNIQNNQKTITPPITTDAVMKHEYRGVCSKCHIIVDRAANSNTGNIIGAAYGIGPGGCIIR